MFFILVNEEEKKYAYSPAPSTFNLGEGWTFYTLHVANADWKNPTQPMELEVASWLEADYNRVDLFDLIGTKWVTHQEFCDFLTAYKSSDTTLQRLGQAFLNKFHDRFSEPWPELFYCTDKHKAAQLIRDITF